MIEMRRLKNVVIFIQTILSFVLSGKIVNICNDIARKYGNVTVNNKVTSNKTKHREAGKELRDLTKSFTSNNKRILYFVRKNAL